MTGVNDDAIVHAGRARRGAARNRYVARIFASMVAEHGLSRARGYVKLYDGTLGVPSRLRGARFHNWLRNDGKRSWPWSDAAI